jgi:hypothetical protein
MTTTKIYIDSDTRSIGATATNADLDRYADNLSVHLSEHFDRAFEVIQVAGGGCYTCPSDHEVDEYVRGLQSGDGWLHLI